jgi:chaperonin cofactor prefoldin
MDAVKIDKLQQKLKKLKEELQYWVEEFKPSGNMGKWAQSVRISRLNEKIKNVQSKIMDEMKKGYS